MVNQHRVEHGKMHIGISAIIFAFRRMNPLVTKIRKRTQASVNQTGWAEARYNQTKQYLVMLGDITKQDLLDEAKTYPLAPCFDPDLLPKIDRTQLVWFDEMHIKQKAGLNIHADLQIRFSRNSDGKYDQSANEFAPPAYQSVFKYTQEARFCLGVAKV